MPAANTARRPTRSDAALAGNATSAAGHRRERRHDPDRRRREAERRQVEVEVDPVQAERRARDEARDEDQPRVAVEAAEGPVGDRSRSALGRHAPRGRLGSVVVRARQEVAAAADELALALVHAAPQFAQVSISSAGSSGATGDGPARRHADRRERDVGGWASGTCTSPSYAAERPSAPPGRSRRQRARSRPRRATMRFRARWPRRPDRRVGSTMGMPRSAEVARWRPVSATRRRCGAADLVAVDLDGRRIRSTLDESPTGTSTRPGQVAARPELAQRGREVARGARQSRRAMTRPNGAGEPATS